MFNFYRHLFTDLHRYWLNLHNKSGANGITLTFFAYIPNAAAFYFFIMIFRKVSFKLTKKELIDIILLGVVGGSFSMISLYAAYDYISTGLATTLHFIYPLIIVITSDGGLQRKNQEDKTSCGYACHARNVYVC